MKWGFLCALLFIAKERLTFVSVTNLPATNRKERESQTSVNGFKLDLKQTVL